MSAQFCRIGTSQFAMIRFLLPLAVLLLFFLRLRGQEKLFLQPGSPLITNYTAQDYLEAGKNRDMAQGKDGRMYFANNYGLVEFNGYDWQRIGQPLNQSELRSFLILEDRIYIGGTAEIGFFKRNGNGTTTYTLLNDVLIEDDFVFSDVREIAAFEEHVFFLTDNGMMVYEGDSVRVWEKGVSFRATASGIEELYFAANERGLYTFSDGGLIQIADAEKFAGMQIEFLLSIAPETFLIGTSTKGVLRYQDNSLEVWNEKRKYFFSGQPSTARHDL